MTREQRLERDLRAMLMRFGDYQRLALESGEPWDGPYLTQARQYADNARYSLGEGKSSAEKATLQCLGRCAKPRTPTTV